MDREFLEKLYVQEKKSYREIAEQTGVHQSSVYRWIVKYGLVGQRKTFEDLTGRVFGKLAVTRHIKTGRYPNGGVYQVWECRCECGRMISVRAGNLKNGQESCKQCADGVRSENLREFPFDSKVWFGMVYRSRQKGLELTVTPEYLYRLYIDQQRRCALSGVLIGFGKSCERGTSTASPDRIDPTKGYVEGNVRWVHKTVNCMRNCMDTTEFVDWCQRVVDFATPNA